MKSILLLSVASFVACNTFFRQSYIKALPKHFNEAAQNQDFVTLATIDEMKSWLRPIFWAQNILAAEETVLLNNLNSAWTERNKVKALDVLFPGSVTEENYAEMVIALKGMAKEMGKVHSNEAFQFNVDKFKKQDMPTIDVVQNLVYYQSRGTLLLDERVKKIAELKIFCQNQNVTFESLVKKMSGDPILTSNVVSFLETSGEKKLLKQMLRVNLEKKPSANQQKMRR